MNSGTVLLDSNSLIYSLKHKVDIRNQLLLLPEISEICVPSCVRVELDLLGGKVPYSSGARTLAEKFNNFECEGPADDCLVELAGKYSAMILTNDRGLILRAHSNGIRTLSFLGGKRIGFSRPRSV
ncbi:MAG: hypothetical protein M1393_06150 [Candidatus Thermoplasmatota archaeon]|nr:hypothetical protein [Candidatus Thermoplasmatota archaeon]MDA8143281.1 hypothetical protein [Thermoplasmatales archaeon]